MTTPRRPSGRYDEPRVLPRPVLIAGAAVLIGLLTVASYLAFDRAQGDRVDVGLTGYEVRSDSSVSISFEVSKPRDVVAVCRLEALDALGSQVGTALVRVAAPEQRVRATEVLATTGRAATGTVVGCRAESTAGPARP